MNIDKKFSCGFWNVGIIESPVKTLLEGGIIPKIKWMRHTSKSKFYADPFPIDEDNSHYYILAEEYDYFSEKGVIVKLAIDKYTYELRKRELVLETNFHLSFPFPFEGGIVPEQYKSGKLFFYKDGIEKCICDYPVIDPVILKKEGVSYLFGTLPCGDNKGHNRSLFWFKYNGQKYQLVDECPIKEDVRSSRAAGVFFMVNSKLYRASQDCEKLYGGQVKIMEVTIEDNKYSEKVILTVNSSSEERFNEGLHTFNPWNNIVIVDGFQFERRFFLKPIFVLERILRKIMKF